MCRQHTRAGKADRALTSSSHRRDPRNKGHRVHQLEPEAESDDSIYTVSSGERKQYFSELTVQGTDNKQVTVKFQVDSGATCSTLTLTDYRQLSDQPPKPSTATLKTYNGASIQHKYAVPGGYYM